jgi:hypothetical protein
MYVPQARINKEYPGKINSQDPVKAAAFREIAPPSIIWPV